MLANIFTEGAAKAGAPHGVDVVTWMLFATHTTPSVPFASASSEGKDPSDEVQKARCHIWQSSCRPRVLLELWRVDRGLQTLAIGSVDHECNC